MTLFRLVAALAALTVAGAFEAADPEPGAAFNKEELEKILRAELVGGGELPELTEPARDARSLAELLAAASHATLCRCAVCVLNVGERRSLRWAPSHSAAAAGSQVLPAKRRAGSVASFDEIL